MTQGYGDTKLPKSLSQASGGGSTTLVYTVLYITTLHYNALQYTALHCAIHHYTTLQCTALH